MLREIIFTIYEKPIPQKRHRHTKKGITYDPCKHDKLAHKILIQNAITQYSTLKEHLLCGPIEIDIRFHFQLPMTKKSRQSKCLYHHQRPDLDNLVKYILDCMNNLLYADDAYIFKITAAKYYTTNEARTEVKIKEVVPEPIIEGDIDGRKKTQMSYQKSFIPATRCDAKLP